MPSLIQIDIPEIAHTHDYAQEAFTVDTAALERDLRSVIEGEVRFSEGDRAMYSTDASNYRQVPIGVVLPRSVDDAIAAVALCRAHGAPVISRGGGTAIPGQSCNVAVMIDFSKYMHDVLSIDPEARLARVQPGTVLDTLRNGAEHHHLTFGPDPATHSRCTLGGMIGNNSCGIHSVLAGRTSDNVERLEILTYDGLRMWVGRTSDEEYDRIIAAGGRRAEIYAALRELRDRYADLIRARYPRIPRRVSGYNLIDLLPENGFNVARALVGSEGTCVTVLEAEVRLIPSPPVRSLLVIGFRDVAEAADHVPQVLPYEPIGLEGLDDEFIEDMKLKGLHPSNLDIMPEGRGWLMIEFGGDTKEEADAAAKKLLADARDWKNVVSTKLFDDPGQERLIWGLREEGLGATAHVPGRKENHEGWEDAAVPPEHVGHYLRDFRDLMQRYDYHGSLYGHFGDGCVHTRLDFDLETADGIAKYRAFVEDAADLVVRYGGSLSGEHGDGQARGELLEKMYGPELIEAFREFKAIWDPEWRMNPGKLVEPYRLDQNLRLGTDYNPPAVKTHFHYPGDGFSFAAAQNRCVGAGVCRRHEGGTMCPSYMVTLEEKHSTRGRARLLFEMLEGNPLSGGWRNEEVREALDLCLACKGCKGECPVHIDMATYKSEFLSHYYEGRLRPRTAYTMGRIHLWSRLASHFPRIANFLTGAPVLGGIARAVAGVHPNRTIPRFAEESFVDWFSRRRPSLATKRVILWPDTFNNYMLPQTAHAAVRVLERAGFSVSVPRGNFCCGRPLYDWGLIEEARGLLEHVLTALAPEIERGTPVVVLEPSCASVFRDELLNLFPWSEEAKRLSRQTYLLPEFLVKYAPDFRTESLDRAAIVHGHCHHKSIMSMSDEETILRNMNVDFRTLDSGCCGMAGAFGFEKEHYDVSIAVGERVLLPAVRGADDETLIIADGFSCREQIEQTTGRRALHLAEVLAMAIDEEESEAASGPTREHSAPEQSRGKALMVAGAVVATGCVLLWLGVRALSTRLYTPAESLSIAGDMGGEGLMEDLWMNQGAQSHEIR
jgi:FAD/FMN-containing dehydrogenase/Fe-S oxidoreductase